MSRSVAVNLRVSPSAMFACLFGIDMKTREFVWLNMAREGAERIRSCDVERLIELLN